MGKKLKLTEGMLREFVRMIVSEEMGLEASGCGAEEESMLEAWYDDDENERYRAARDRMASKMSKQDDGWSGRKDWGAAADEEMDRRAMRAVAASGMSNDEALRRRAIDSLHYSGAQVTDASIAQQMLHLKKLGSR